MEARAGSRPASLSLSGPSPSRFSLYSHSGPTTTVPSNPNCLRCFLLPCSSLWLASSSSSSIWQLVLMRRHLLLWPCLVLLVLLKAAGLCWSVASTESGAKGVSEAQLCPALPQLTEDFPWVCLLPPKTSNGFNASFLYPELTLSYFQTPMKKVLTTVVHGKPEMRKHKPPLIRIYDFSAKLNSQKFSLKSSHSSYCIIQEFELFIFTENHKVTDPVFCHWIGGDWCFWNICLPWRIQTLFIIEGSTCWALPTKNDALWVKWPRTPSVLKQNLGSSWWSSKGLPRLVWPLRLCCGL